mmetsp:Transcript_3057/g.8444  ORF Transcript_3057/g.8444 Transcript_3057/m.8444 type:complete len:156 (-) Transcript_3057:1403-1870(-)
MKLAIPTTKADPAIAPTIAPAITPADAVFCAGRGPSVPVGSGVLVGVKLGDAVAASFGVGVNDGVSEGVGVGVALGVGVGVGGAIDWHGREQEDARVGSVPVSVIAIVHMTVFEKSDDAWAPGTIEPVVVPTEKYLLFDSIDLTTVSAQSVLNVT